jgi:hypothetical protein
MENNSLSPLCPSLAPVSPSYECFRSHAAGKFREIAGFGLISDRRISELSERRSCRQRYSGVVAPLLHMYPVGREREEDGGGISLCVPPRVADIYRAVRIV